MGVDLTQGTQKQKNERSKKMMLWFGIVSLIMGFAGWTSAYIVSRSREDWISELELPSLFFISTAVILISSITYHFSKKAVQKSNNQMGSLWLWATLALGILFIVLQFAGFSEMVANGYYFTGPTSNPKSAFVFVIVMAHVFHLLAGIITLLVVLFNQIKKKYTSENILGLELGATFWHFLGLLWLYLILFMYFVK